MNYHAVPLQSSINPYESKIPIASMTLNSVPIYGKVRIILTPGIKNSGTDDGILEYNIADVLRNLSLLVIKEAIYGKNV